MNTLKNFIIAGGGLQRHKETRMIVFVVFVILACLGIGTFALLSWQTTPIIWAQPIVFIFGCLSFIFVGALIVALIIFIKESKN